jgi:hypothetical protein
VWGKREGSKSPSQAFVKKLKDQPSLLSSTTGGFSFMIIFLEEEVGE